MNRNIFFSGILAFSLTLPLTTALAVTYDDTYWNQFYGDTKTFAQSNTQAQFSATAQFNYTGGDFYQCMQQAVDVREQAYIESQRIYSEEYLAAMEARHQAYVAAWQITDDRSRRNAEREADRDFRDATRQSARDQRDRDRDIRNDFRENERFCNDVRDNNPEPANPGGGDFCIFNRDCPVGYGCENERCTPLEGNACVRQEDCPAGTECTDNRCTPVTGAICFFNRDCPVGTECKDGHCTGGGDPNRCFSDNDCGIGGYQCQNGVCVPPRPQTNNRRCRSSLACAPGYHCSVQDGECLSPCSPGEVCIQVCEGRCVLNNF